MYPVTIDWTQGWFMLAVLAVVLVYVVIRIVWVVKKKERTRKDISDVTIMIVVMILLGGLLLGMGRISGITLKDGILKARFLTGFKTVEITQDEIQDIRVVDWAQDTAYRPSRRTMGTAIGSYLEGRFTLNNGQSALLLTRSSKVILLDTSEGLLMLGPDELEKFQKDLDAQMNGTN
jgi:hypothetical protein